MIDRHQILTGEGLPIEGFIMKECTINGVSLSFYGGELISCKINGKDIEDIFPIEQADGADDELMYRITEDAIEYVLSIING